MSERESNRVKEAALTSTNVTKQQELAALEDDENKIDKELAALRYKANTEPGALSDSEILRYTAYLDLHHGNFLNIYRNYRDGLVPEEDWEYAKAAIGWAFFSEPAMDYVEILDASNVESPVHAFIEESVSIARAYCNNPANKCVKRYDVQRSWKN